jgi:hypothetical protein
MLTVGDTVVFSRDGAKGIIIGIDGDLFHVMWEDTFISWEKAESLQKVEPPSGNNRK